MTIGDIAETFFGWLDPLISIVPSWLRIVVVVLFIVFVISRRLRKLFKPYTNVGKGNPPEAPTPATQEDPSDK